MSRFVNFLNELSSNYGMGITAVDLDECLFKTFSKIYVINDETGKIVEKLNNQEFNTYKIQDGFSFDFREFRNAKMFRETSIPIPQTVNRIKRIFKNIDIRNSKVIFLTARSDFDDKNEFLNTFRDYDIPIDKIYVERVGNMKTGTIAEKKEKVILKYLSTGLYRRVRLIDDDLQNLKKFLSIENKIPQNIINKVKKKYNITKKESIKPIEFYALLVKKDGSILRIK